MRAHLVLVLLTLAACSGKENTQQEITSNTEDSLQSEKQGSYVSCVACHGEKGEGNESLGAPTIAGLDDWYVERQLIKFQNGIRGNEAEGSNAMQMAAVVKTLRKEDMVALAGYISKLKTVTSQVTVQGDVAKGKQVYDMICGACHGPAGKGNRSLNAPALTGLNDWYLIQQFNRFKDGTRGSHPDDTFGAQMAAMASTLPSEESLNDVVAYLKSVNR